MEQPLFGTQGAVWSDPRLRPGTPAAVEARARHENFPVASRLLPSDVRRHLLAIYGYARLVDDIGDEAAGDRRALLGGIDADLDAVFDGAVPRHPTLQRLADTVAALDLPEAPFRDLIEANRRDQRVHRYGSYGELLEYCRVSANPVGHLVLHVFGAATDERLQLSDRICTALQVVEHCQDVGEDARRGRVYLPAEDLAHVGCTYDELTAATTTPALRRAVALQAARARRLIDEGAPLVGTLRGAARIACAGFVAGGRAALDALHRHGYDVLGRQIRPAPHRVARHAAVTWAVGR